MRTIAQFMSIIMIVGSGTSCSVNIMEGFAQTDTNEAIYFHAKQLVNESQYATALTEIAKLTGTYPAKSKVILLKASANAGVCGLNFVNLITGLQNLGATTFFNFLRTRYNNSSAANDAILLASCVTAEALISGIGATPALRTADQNIFIAMVAFMRLGAWMSATADVNNDNAIDVGYETCTMPSGSPTISDAQTAQIGTAINVGFDSLFASGISLGPYTAASWTAFCTALGADNFCNLYSAAAITGRKLEGVRALVRDSTAGLGTCTTDAAGPLCGIPCP